jgi:DNA transformation protein
MAFDTELRDRIVGMLLPLEPVAPRSMFGGCGLYLDGVMFALIWEDTLFLKTDGKNRPRFEAEGCAPFTYETGDGRNVVMSYSATPTQVMMDQSELLDWVEGAVAAALRARNAKSSGKRLKRAPGR